MSNPFQKILPVGRCAALYINIQLEYYCEEGGRYDGCIDTAVRYARCIINYYPQISMDGDFWIIVNTELSDEGCPTSLVDETPNCTGEAHSFYSYDFILWEPWTTASVDLSHASWGCIKGLFRYLQRSGF